MLKENNLCTCHFSQAFFGFVDSLNLSAIVFEGLLPGHKRFTFNYHLLKLHFVVSLKEQNRYQIMTAFVHFLKCNIILTETF